MGTRHGTGRPEPGSERSFPKQGWRQPQTGSGKAWEVATLQTGLRAAGDTATSSPGQMGDSHRRCTDVLRTPPQATGTWGWWGGQAGVRTVTLTLPQQSHLPAGRLSPCLDTDMTPGPEEYVTETSEQNTGSGGMGFPPFSAGAPLREADVAGPKTTSLVSILPIPPPRLSPGSRKGQRSKGEKATGESWGGGVLPACTRHC